MVITNGECVPTIASCTSDSAGSQTVTASFEGKTAEATQVVGPAATTSALISSVNPSVTGQSVTYSATVAVSAPGSGTPTGFIEFLDGSTPIGACGGAAGVSLNGTLSAACALTYPATGTHTITAQYLGDANYTGSSSSTLTQVVGPAATTSALISSVNPSVTGQSVTYSATVAVSAPGSGTPTGFIEFLDGSTPIGACGGAAGVSLNGTLSAACALTYPATGTHTITAQYLGDANYTGSSSSTLTQVVGPAATTSALISSVNPSVTGQSVTYSATVAVSAPGSGTPTGFIEFLDGSTPIGACGGAAGVSLNGTLSAACALTYPATGTHTITAQYLGDANYTGSSSSTLTQVVGPAATTSALISSVNPSVTGQSVTYSATVAVSAPGSGTPTGFIEFLDESTPIGACGGAAGVSLNGTLSAACALTYPATGTHTITAQYLGDANYTGSSSSTLTQVVGPAATTSALISSVNPSVTGQSVTYSATVAVSAPGSGTPTGFIEFLDGSTPIGACGGAAGVSLNGTLSAACALTYPATGTHTITAQYLGDANYTGSSSSTLTQVVGPAATTSALISSVNPSVTGQSVTYSATVAVSAPGSGTPTGFIEFLDGSTPIGACGGAAGVSLNGTLSAACALTYPATGTHTITAQYLGDANYTGSSSSTLTQVVGPAATSATVLSTDSSAYVVGQTITISATVAPVAPATGTPTGTVSVSDGATPPATCVITLTGGAGHCTLSEPSPGTYTFIGTYGGDVVFTTSSGSASAVVGRDASSTVVTDNASSPVSGTGFTFTAAVTAAAPGSGIPAGTVAWTVIDPDGQPVSCATGSVVSGVATCTISHAVAGLYRAAAAFTDTDGDFNDSASLVDAVVVARASTTTSVLSISPAVSGQPFTVEVSVVPQSPATGVPTGTVTVSDGTSGCTVTLSAGAGSCHLSANAGSYGVTALYNGDANFQPSHVSAAFVVAQAATATEIVSTAPSVTGQPFAVAVWVAPVAPGAGIPTGIVTVSDGTGSCTVTLAGGSGDCSLTDNAGTYSISATYHGDASFLGSATSASDTVSPAPQTITFTSSPPASATVGGAVYVVAATGGASGNPVTFSSATPAVCTVAGSTITLVGSGTCTIEANQVGNDYYLAAPQATQSFSVRRVERCRSSIELFPQYPWPVAVGSSVTFSAFVEQISGTPPLSGTITFYVDGIKIPNCVSLGPIHNAAHCNINFPVVGSAKVTATYTGDQNYPDSVDSTIQLVVKGTTAVKVTSTTPVVSGTHATYTAAISELSGAVPLTGTVSFTLGGSPVVACQNVTLSGAAAGCVLTISSPGTYVIVATYSGDANFTGSTGSLTVVLASARLEILTTSLAEAHPGQVDYSQNLEGTGGTAPYRWSISSGVLPAGLSLSASTGHISGTVSDSASTETFGVELTDAFRAVANRSFTLTMDERPHFTCGASLEATPGRPFSFMVTAVGTPRPTLSESGRLPAGVSFDPATGELSGTATGAGAFKVTFTASNVAGSQSLDFTLRF